MLESVNLDMFLVLGMQCTFQHAHLLLDYLYYVFFFTRIYSVKLLRSNYVS